MIQNALPSPPHRFWSTLASRYGRSGAGMLLVLLVLAMGCGVYAARAEKPWGKVVQKRVLKKQELGPREYGIVGVWYGTAGGALALAALAATARLWLPRREDKEAGRSESAGEPSNPDFPVRAFAPFAPASSVPQSSRWFWAGLLIIVALAGWERAPRLGQSFWNDEEYSLRAYSHGRWLEKDGVLTFQKVSWDTTLFENRKGNNHLLSATIARVSLNAWQAATGAPEGAFSEYAVRMPAYLASLLTVVVVGWLGLQMGGPVVGLGAALLLTLSPWHVRYSVESKGYSYMLLFMVVNLAAILQALRTGKLRWWTLFALSEAAYLLAFAGSVYVAFAVNLLVAADLLWHREFPKFRTLVAFNLLGAIPVIIWMLPSVPQLMAYLEDEDSLRLGMGWPWMRDYLSGLVLGWQYFNPFPEVHSGTSWLMERERSSWLYPVVLQGLIPFFALLGLVASFRKQLTPYLGVLGLTLAGLLAYWHNHAKDHPMVVWYLIYTVIPLSLAVPLGIRLLTRRAMVPALVITMVLAGAYASVTWEALRHLREHDRQPIRQTAEYIHSTAPDALTATFGVSDRQSQSYDRGVKVLESVADLDSIQAAARSKGVPLFVYVCGPTETLKRHPELHARVFGNGAFEHVKSLTGAEEMFSYEVFRAR